jgi:hypothetical protein
VPYLFGEQQVTNFSGNHTLYVHQRPEGHGQAKLSILGGYEVGKRAQASHGPFDYPKDAQNQAYIP